MANSKRKATPKAQKAVGAPAAYIDDDGYLALRGELFWKWRALNADYNSAVAVLNTRKLEFERLLAEVPALAAKRGETQVAAQVLEQAKRDLAEVQQAISAELCVDLTTCAIDDTTGRLHVLPLNMPIPADVKAKKVTGVSRRGRAATKQPTTE